MIEWEYRVCYPHSEVYLQEYLNKLGAEGWELVVVMQNADNCRAPFILKRPLPAPSNLPARYSKEDTV